MVAIPMRGDPTLEAMFSAIKERQDRGRRDYLGASLIGNECARQIWYEYNKYDRPDFEAKTLLLFEDGHRTEDLTAERLRLVDGIELLTHNEDGEQFGFKHGKLKGHIDGKIRGLIQAPAKWHIWECKSSGQKKFDEFKKLSLQDEKSALQKWNMNYYVQAQLYMHFFDMDRHYTTVALGGGRDYASCRTEYDMSVALKYIDRAEKIISATSEPPRLSENPDFFICRWCAYKDICHNEDTQTISKGVFGRPF